MLLNEHPGASAPAEAGRSEPGLREASGRSGARTASECVFLLSYVLYGLCLFVYFVFMCLSVCVGEDAV